MQINLTDLMYPLCQKKLKLEEDYSSLKELKQTIYWIANNTELNTYILVQDILVSAYQYDLPVSHYMALIPLFSEKPIIGSLYGTRYISMPLSDSEADTLLGYNINNITDTPSLLYERAKKLGVTYIAVHDFKLKQTFNHSKYFKLVYKNDIYSVYKLDCFNPIISIEDGHVFNIKIKVNLIQFNVVASRNSSISIRLINYPGLKCFIDNYETSLDKYYFKLSKIKIWNIVINNYSVPFIKISIPKGFHKVTITYTHNNIGYYITFISLIFILIYDLYYIMFVIKRYAKHN